MDRSIVDRIRTRAYEIWISTGCPEGQAEYHWLAAENEILQSGSTLGPSKEFASGQKARARREPRKAIKKTA